MRKVIIWIILEYIRLIAKIALKLHTPKVIGITGSVGKSSCRDMIYSGIKDHVSVKVIEKGNSEIGIPLGIVGLSVHENTLLEWLKMLILMPFRLSYLKHTEYLIIEMGIDEPDSPKNMEYLLTIVQPYIAIFLNTYAVHTMQFDKTVAPEYIGKKRVEEIVKQIAHEKGKIITQSYAKYGIINRDDHNISHIVEHMERKIILNSFGKSEKNDVCYGDYELTPHGTVFHLFLKSKKKEEIQIKIRGFLLPQVYQEVLAAAILVGKILHIPQNLMVRSLEENFRLPPGRATLFDGIQNSIIIDSSYNASRHAVLAFLHMVAELKKTTHRPVVFLFGDMRELGNETAHEHKIIAHAISEVADYAYCIGPCTKQYVIPIIQDKVKSVRWFENALQLGEYVKTHLPEDAILLVKGSQNTIFLEEAIKFLLLKRSDEKHLCRQSKFWMKKKYRQN